MPREVAVVRRGETTLEPQSDPPKLLSDDDALEVWVWLERLKQQFRRVRQTAEADLIAYIEANGPLEFGESKIRAVTRKTEKVRDQSAAIDEALSILLGDMDVMVQLFRANALKPAACGVVLGKDFRDRHFELTWAPVLDATKARKELAKVPNWTQPRRPLPDNDKTPEPPGYGNPDNHDLEKIREREEGKPEDPDIDY